MKKILFILLLFVTSHGFAQSAKEEIDLIQSAFGLEKKAMAEQFIKVEGKAKDAFWTAYDEYETERKELGKKRIGLLDQYATNYLTLDDVTLDKLTLDIISLQSQTDKLITTYYKKIKKVSGVKPAAQFYQFENYVLSKIRGEILESIPLIGEFDKN